MMMMIGDGNSNQIQNIQKIRNSLEISSSFLSSSSETSLSSNFLLNSSNSINNIISKLISLKSTIFSLVLIKISIALQEALAFKEEENKTVHFL
jgi:hypothetical protein